MSISRLTKSGIILSWTGYLVLPPDVEKPTEGSIFYNDKDISTKRNIQDRKDIQVVQQNPLTSLNPKNKISSSIIYQTC